MLNMLKFKYHKQASQVLGLSIKSTRKQEGILYTIDKTIEHPKIKWKNCKICQQKSMSSQCRRGYCKQCRLAGLGHKNSGDPESKTIWKVCVTCGTKSKSSECRKGYCKSCTSKGLGHKLGGQKLSKIFSGKSNPNYVHGKTKNSLLQRKNQWYKWGRFVFYKHNYQCVLSGRTDDLQSHHVVPFAICAKLRFMVENGVILNRFYHIELHRRSLDLVLLANLVLLELDAQELAEWFVHQPQVQSLLRLPYQIHDQHELIRVAGQNCRKQLSHLHPEFDPSSLDRLASK